jgi:hypothetical protein
VTKDWLLECIWWKIVDAYQIEGVINQLITEVVCEHQKWGWAQSIAIQHIRDKWEAQTDCRFNKSAATQKINLSQHFEPS